MHADREVMRFAMPHRICSHPKIITTQRLDSARPHNSVTKSRPSRSFL